MGTVVLMQSLVYTNDCMSTTVPGQGDSILSENFHLLTILKQEQT